MVSLQKLFCLGLAACLGSLPLSASEPSPAYTFSGGYKIGDESRVLLRIEDRSVWMKPGMSVGEVLLKSVSEDFQSVTLLVGEEEIHVPIASARDEPIHVESGEDIVLPEQYSPQLEELRGLMLAQGFTPEVVEGHLAHAHRQEMAVKEIIPPKNGTQFSREEILVYAQAQASTGNLILWREDENGMVTDMKAVLWPAEPVVDPETGTIRVVPMPEEKAFETFARQFEAFNGAAVDALPVRPQP